MGDPRGDILGLVADEDGPSIEVVKAQFAGLGLQARACGSTNEIEAALTGALRAILVIDAGFGGACTVELIPALIEGSVQEGRRLVVIVVSAEGGSRLALEATKAGAFRYLTKPLRPALLNLVMQDALLEFTTPIAPTVPEPAEETKTAEVLAGQLLPGRRYSLERIAVYENVPADSGVLTFYDERNEALAVEWTQDLCERLNYYLDVPKTLSATAREARVFEFLPTQDRGQEAKVFDRLVNRFDRFPRLMKRAPDGSSHVEGPPEPPSDQKSSKPDKAVPPSKKSPAVTHFASTPDKAMVEKLRALVSEKPEDPDMQDWLAYTLYSNNLLDEAIGWYSRLIQGGSKRVEHFFYCGNAFYKRGDLSRALRLWRLAAKLKPGSVIAEKSLERIHEHGGDVPVA